MNAITFDNLLEYGALNFYLRSYADKTDDDYRDKLESRVDAARQLLADFFFTADTSDFLSDHRTTPKKSAITWQDFL